MIKKVLKTTILAGSVLAMVGTASAAPDTCECAINIYGASAQYKFWTSAAPDLLKSWGCADADIYVATGEGDCGRDNGIAVCAGPVEAIDGKTGAGIDGKTFCLRYSTKASYDGIYAVSNQNPLGTDQPPCETGSPDFQPGCSTPPEGYRLMADETQTTLVQYQAGTGTVNACVCRDVHIGASDVEASAFQQASSGGIKGPCDSTPESRSIFNVDTYLCAGNRFHNPVIVPFAFFKNNDAVDPVPFDNMNDVMAAAIFSGAVTNWNDFGPSVPSLPIKVCLRHAGSGTHATLFASILYHQGASLMTQELGPTHPLVLAGIAPVTYFNDGSSDIMKCINGTCADATGAVGYADADKIGSGSSYPDTQRMLFNGFGCVSAQCTGDSLDTETVYKDAITHGRYTFWADQHLYSCPWDFSTGIDPDCYNCGSTDWIASLATFASDPANLPSSKADFWAAQSEMQVTRANAFAVQKFK
jgi:hypothetical protein